MQIVSCFGKGVGFARREQHARPVMKTTTDVTMANCCYRRNTQIPLEQRRIQITINQTPRNAVREKIDNEGEMTHKPVNDELSLIEALGDHTRIEYRILDCALGSYPLERARNVLQACLSGQGGINVLGEQTDSVARAVVDIAAHPHASWRARNEAVSLLQTIGSTAETALEAVYNRELEYAARIKILVVMKKVGVKMLIHKFIRRGYTWQEREAAITLLVAGHKHGEQIALDSLATALKDESIEVRIAAVRALSKLGDTQSVTLLAEVLLNDSSPKVRWWAVKKLGEIGDKAAVPALIASLADNSPKVRWDAVQAVENLGEERAVDLLIQCLNNDKDASIRYSAARALRWIGDEQAVEPLVARLHDRNAEVRIEAAKALGNMGETQAVAPLLKMLTGGDEDKTVQCEIIGTLGEIGDKAAVPALIETALWSMYISVRRKAICALGEIGDTRAVAPLITVLNDPNADKRRAYAAEALGKIGDAQAVAPLIAALGEEDNIRWKAIWALGKIGDKAAVPALIAVLGNDNKGKVRQETAHALGALGDAQTVTSLIVALEDENRGVRREAAWALGKLSVPSTVPVLIKTALKDKEEGVRKEARKAAKTIDETTAIDLLTKRLKGAEEQARQAALVLGEIGSQQVVVPLTTCLIESEWYTETVRHAAVTALGGLDVAIQRTDTTVIKTLVVALGDNASIVREEAARILSQIGQESIGEALNNNYQDSIFLGRVLSLVSSLKTINSEPAKKLLREITASKQKTKVREFTREV